MIDVLSDVAKKHGFTAALITFLVITAWLNNRELMQVIRDQTKATTHHTAAISELTAELRRK